MKRIEFGMKVFAVFVFALIAGILVYTGKILYSDSTAGNFTPTPGVTMNAIEAQAKKDNLLLIFYEPDAKSTKLLKPEMTKRSQLNAGSTTAPKVVYLAKDDKKNASILNHFGIGISDAVQAVPVLKGGSEQVSIVSEKNDNIPIGRTDLTSDNGNKVTIQTNYLDVYFTANWGN
ncbi:MAG: hypothetical protein LBT37_06165 [Lactobacillaceae bacterium]|jgi:hypothetical protein|nr:hypothetical protein [Lactobacillaceae bacterium]